MCNLMLRQSISAIWSVVAKMKFMEEEETTTQIVDSFACNWMLHMNLNLNPTTAIKHIKPIPKCHRRCHGGFKTSCGVSRQNFWYYTVRRRLSLMLISLPLVGFTPFPLATIKCLSCFVSSAGKGKFIQSLSLDSIIMCIGGRHIDADTLLLIACWHDKNMHKISSKNMSALLNVCHWISMFHEQNVKIYYNFPIIRIF